MSTLKVNNLQVGQSATASQNFTLYQPSTPDGTVRLGYGNTGSVTDALSIKNNGNIGIGTTNPTVLLDGVGTTNAILRLTGGSSVNEGAAYYIKFSSDPNTLTAYGDTARIVGGTPDQSSMIYNAGIPLHFYVNQGYRMTVATSGNVGIGTTNPTALLKVGSVNYNTGSPEEVMLILQANTSTVNDGHFMQFGDDGQSSRSQIGSVVTDTNESALVFKTNNAGTLGEKLRITTTGRVGIGTTNPLSELHVENSSTCRIRLRGQGQDYTQANIALRATSVGNPIGNSRGLGVFMYDEVATNEWYAGRAYSSSDRYIIARKNAPVDIHGEASALSNAFLHIDGAGRVMKPSQVGFMAYGVGNNSGFLTFTNEYYDYGGHFDAPAGIFTAPVAGRYLFTFSILMNGSSTSGSYQRILFAINNTSNTRYGDTLIDGTGTYSSPGMCMIFYLQLGDTVRLVVTGTGLYGSDYGAFSGMLLA